MSAPWTTPKSKQDHAKSKQDVSLMMNVLMKALVTMMIAAGDVMTVMILSLMTPRGGPVSCPSFCVDAS